MQLEAFRNPFWQRNRGAGHTSAAALSADPAGVRVSLYRDASNRHGGLAWFALLQPADASAEDSSGFAVRDASGEPFEARSLDAMGRALDAGGYPAERRGRLFLQRIEGRATVVLPLAR